MMRPMVLMLLAVCLLFAAESARASDAGTKPKYTIKQVMKKAHKDGLMKKLAMGEGSKEDAKELLELYEALGESKPPRGAAENWKKMTQEMVDAAQDVVHGKKDAGHRLTKAANCMGCHRMHKPAK